MSVAALAPAPHHHHDTEDQIVVVGYVVAMLDLVVGDTCRMCHANDDTHTIDCPVPALEHWLETQ